MVELSELTNDAQFLLSKMYAQYIKLRKNGYSKPDAVKFNDVEYIKETIMPEWQEEDVQFTVSELYNYDLLFAVKASNTFLRISLKPKAISLMESKFKDKVDEVLDYANKIKNLIPFI